MTSFASGSCQGSLLTEHSWLYEVVLLEAQGTLQEESKRMKAIWKEQMCYLPGCQQPVMDVGVVHKALTLLTE